MFIMQEEETLPLVVIILLAKGCGVRLFDVEYCEDKKKYVLVVVEQEDFNKQVTEEVQLYKDTIEGRRQLDLCCGWVYEKYNELWKQSGISCIEAGRPHDYQKVRLRWCMSRMKPHAK